MKSFLSLLVISVATLGAYGCGSSDGPSCADVCAKMAECNPEDAVGCDTQCAQMKDVMRDSVYSALGNCFIDTDCETLNKNDDVCMVEAMAEIPGGVPDSFVGKICEKIASCDENQTKEQCVSSTTQEGGDSIQMIGIFKDSIIDCVTDCFSAKDCSAIDTAMDKCMTECGMDMEGDE